MKEASSTWKCSFPGCVARSSSLKDWLTGIRSGGKRVGLCPSHRAFGLDLVEKVMIVLGQISTLESTDTGVLVSRAWDVAATSRPEVAVGSLIGIVLILERRASAVCAGLSSAIEMILDAEGALSALGKLRLRALEEVLRMDLSRGWSPEMDEMLGEDSLRGLVGDVDGGGGVDPGGG